MAVNEDGYQEVIGAAEGRKEDLVRRGKFFKAEVSARYAAISLLCLDRRSVNVTIRKAGTL